MNSAVAGNGIDFRSETVGKMRSGEGREVIRAAAGYTTALACGKHVARRSRKCGIMTNQRTNDVVLPG